MLPFRNALCLQVGGCFGGIPAYNLNGLFRKDACWVGLISERRISELTHTPRVRTPSQQQVRSTVTGTLEPHTSNAPPAPEAADKLVRHVLLLQLEVSMHRPGPPFYFVDFACRSLADLRLGGPCRVNYASSAAKSPCTVSLHASRSISGASCAPPLPRPASYPTSCTGQ